MRIPAPDVGQADDKPHARRIASPEIGHPITAAVRRLVFHDAVRRTDKPVGHVPELRRKAASPVAATRLKRLLHRVRQAGRHGRPARPHDRVAERRQVQPAFRDAVSVEVHVDDRLDVGQAATAGEHAGRRLHRQVVRASARQLRQRLADGEYSPVRLERAVLALVHDERETLDPRAERHQRIGRRASPHVVAGIGVMAFGIAHPHRAGDEGVPLVFQPLREPADDIRHGMVVEPVEVGVAEQLVVDRVACHAAVAGIRLRERARVGIRALHRRADRAHLRKPALVLRVAGAVVRNVWIPVRETRTRRHVHAPAVQFVLARRPLHVVREVLDP